MPSHSQAQQIAILEPSFSGPHGRGGEHWLYYYDFGIGNAHERRPRPLEGTFGLVICSEEYLQEPDPNEPVASQDKPLVLAKFSKAEVEAYVNGVVEAINARKLSSWPEVVEELKRYFYLDD